MGYYSYFDVSVYANPEQVPARDILVWIQNRMKADRNFFYPFEYVVQDLLSPESAEYLAEHPYYFRLSEEEEFKWYAAYREMQELSEAFPSVVFKLNRSGEMPDDNFDSYFKAGQKKEFDGTIPLLRAEDMFL